MTNNTQSLYTSVKQLRQQDQQPFYRILLSGYFNDEEVKRTNINIQKYLKDTITSFSRILTGYLYIKGNFYLHLIEAKTIKPINQYLTLFYALTQKDPNLQQETRIVYQSYQSPDQFFKGWECDYIPQAGPVLTQTDKLDQQIFDRAFEIYQNIEDGAKKKKDNSSYKVANMFLLSNDDMSILISKTFMTLEEYSNIYLESHESAKECEKNYPLPPSIFNTMEFLEIEEYTSYK